MTTSYPELLAQGLLQDPGPAALVIGVTGHRDPTPEATIPEPLLELPRQLEAIIVMEAMGREKIDELNDWIPDQVQRIYRPGG
jgi:hypothetical protein